MILYINNNFMNKVQAALPRRQALHVGRRRTPGKTIFQLKLRYNWLELDRDSLILLLLTVFVH